jgi:hypothetical protein
VLVVPWLLPAGKGLLGALAQKVFVDGARTFVEKARRVVSGVGLTSTAAQA